eukprot:CAMPEP_0201505010 /NCGR_PEP_ID=MMETSP0151_2-20130828/85531_1 /ASSEMBLY_ACC=CAM_ASM_000257 /TAXON_ID=200890 /ORGANISM="Paramoeba atlantica, Strain 621/1 / CCAP 1560/9" /LENGTH=105 /DNA_ID=CAMNT_0047898825 /DNA_START=428 /DNA_END=742 /DNA_ORIENTATION=+
MEYSKGTHLSDFLKEEIAVMKRALETIKGTIVTKLDPKNGEGISSKGSDSLFCFLNEEQKEEHVGKIFQEMKNMTLMELIQSCPALAAPEDMGEEEEDMEEEEEE